MEEKQSYYQAGADGTGSPDVSAQTISDETTSPKVASQESNGNEPVTQAQLQSVLNELREDVLRKAQSHTDKLGSTLDKRVKAAQDEAAKAIKIFKASGQTLTPEQERNINRVAVDQALIASDDSPAVPEQGRQQPKAEPSDIVNTEVQRIMTETGVYIPPEEANALVGQVRSPYEFIRKFEDICNERSTKPHAEARIPTLAPQTGKPVNADVLKRQYDDEMAQIRNGSHPTVRRGNIQQIVNLKAEYKKKGLNVY